MELGFKEKRRRRRSVRSRSIGMPCSDDELLPIASLIAKIKKPSKKSGGKQTSSSRKTRSKIRKPKYLSLRLQFSSSDQRSEESTDMASSPVNTSTDENSGSKQLELFPVHPGHNPVEEKEAHDENMAYLFSAADGGASTLTGLLESNANTNTNTNGSCTSDHGNQENNNDSSGATTLSPSASLTYAYRGRPEEENGRDQEVALVRTALRSKEREQSEERWVRYSEVVERREDQEVSSCTAVPDMAGRLKRNQRLSLKLDYEEILTAWSNKGSLFIHAAATYAEAAAAPPQSPQTVPDIHDDFLASHFPNGMISHGWGNESGCVWRVPEFTVSPVHEVGHSLVQMKMEEQVLGVVPGEVVVGIAEDQWKMEQREASVKRYKEKRQNRLFSKRIRYQVRKLNAEKRPRVKGRFVKS